MAKLSVPVQKRDHVQGPEHAPATLVEYGDFECPHCAHAHGILKALQQQKDPEFRLVYRHLPLSNLHAHAEAAALASEAAAAQGRFWEMHDLLFEKQLALEDEDLLEYARALNLEMKEFVLAMETRKFLPRVKEDLLSGVRSGANGTPTFFIHGIRYDGSFEFLELHGALALAAGMGAHH